MPTPQISNGMIVDPASERRSDLKKWRFCRRWWGPLQPPVVEGAGGADRGHGLYADRVCIVTNGTGVSPKIRMSTMPSAYAMIRRCVDRRWQGGLGRGGLAEGDQTALGPRPDETRRHLRYGSRREARS